MDLSEPLRRTLLALPTAALLLATACSQQQAAEPKAAAPTVAITNAPSGKPQARLATLKLWLGKEELIAEIARTPIQIQTGMMFRTNMAENEAMLFILPVQQRASFWMKNTLLPLSCAYIDSEGTILELKDMKPLDETPLVASSDLVQYVLEVNQGWFKRHNVEPGMKIKTEQGTLRQTFFGR